MSPPNHEWTAGESNPDFLVAGQASFRWTSRPSSNRAERSARESNPARLRTEEVCRQKHLQTLRVVPDGLEPSLPGCDPGVVAAGPRDGRVAEWHGWGSNPQDHRGL